jgi:hypothetical protein
MDITELQRQQTTKRHPWEIERVQVLQYFIKKQKTLPQHIVDIGGGDAFVIKSLCKNKIGSEYTAIDTAYSDTVIEQIKDKNCPIYFYKEIPNVLSHPDCILLMDVLEHCEDDAALLQKAKEVATANTTFYISVPAYQQLFSKHDVKLKHYRRYSENQLRKLCKQTGLVVVESGYFFSSLLLIRCIQLFLEKTGLLKTKKTIDNWNGSNALTKMICALLRIDFLLSRTASKAGIHLPGLSAFCICHPLP